MPPGQEKPKSSAGPIVGTIIILLLMCAGAFYFWQEERAPRLNEVPYIPAGSSTTAVQ